MSTLVLLRHGESAWNAEGLFTGWVDIGLSGAGAREAVAAVRCCANMAFARKSSTLRC